MRQVAERSVDADDAAKAADNPQRIVSAIEQVRAHVERGRLDEEDAHVEDEGYGDPRRTRRNPRTDVPHGIEKEAGTPRGEIDRVTHTEEMLAGECAQYAQSHGDGTQAVGHDGINDLDDKQGHEEPQRSGTENDAIVEQTMADVGHTTTPRGMPRECIALDGVPDGGKYDVGHEQATGTAAQRTQKRAVAMELSGFVEEPGHEEVQQVHPPVHDRMLEVGPCQDVPQNHVDDEQSADSIKHIVAPGKRT